MSSNFNARIRGIAWTGSVNKPYLSWGLLPSAANTALAALDSHIAWRPKDRIQQIHLWYHGDSRNSQRFDKMRWPTACCECPAKFVQFLHVLWCCSGSRKMWSKRHIKISRSMRAETDGSTLATSSMAKQAAVKPRSTPPMSAGTFTDSRLLQHVCWQHFSQQQKHRNFWRVVVICTLCNLWTSPRLDSHEALLKHSIHDLFVHGTLLVHGLDDWNSVGKVQPFQVTLPTLRIWIVTKISNRIQIFSQGGQKCLENSFRQQLSGDFFRLDVRCQDFLREAFGRVT